MTTNITERHKRVFNALISGQHNNFALFSCFLDGEPTVAIVAVNQLPNGDSEIPPMFVGYMDNMVLTDHGGIPADKVEEAK